MLQERFPYRHKQPDPLKPMALALLEALSRYFPIVGKIVVSPDPEVPFFAYANASEALAFLRSEVKIELISIKDHYFSLVLDHTEKGVELDYLAMNPSGDTYYPEIRAICVKVLDELAEP